MLMHVNNTLLRLIRDVLNIAKQKQEYEIAVVLLTLIGSIESDSLESFAEYCSRYAEWRSSDHNN